jgi:hypothetical protein
VNFCEFTKKRIHILRPVLVTIVAILGTLAAALTMGREAVADYELYSADYVSLCKWIEKKYGTIGYLFNRKQSQQCNCLTDRSKHCMRLRKVKKE